MPGGTHELDVQGLTTATVADDPGRAGGIAAVAVAPLHEGEEHGLKVAPHLGQPVLVSRPLPRLAVLRWVSTPWSTNQLSRSLRIGRGMPR
jgi:hypothetical protein